MYRRWLASIALAGLGPSLPTYGLNIPTSQAIPQSNRLYMAGSTSTEQVLVNYLLLSLADGPCANGTVDIYTFKDGGQPAGRFRDFSNLLLTCTGRSNRLFAGQNIAFFKRSTASGDGSKTLADETLLSSLISKHSSATRRPQRTTSPRLV